MSDTIADGGVTMRFRHEEVQRLRIAAGMSRQGLADALCRFGGGPGNAWKVRTWELGKVRPNGQALVALAAALGVKAEDLFEQVPFRAEED